ncbi:MAG TPA: hypothetical protein VJS12_18595 [Steroidobacteraceae bacterium]|nr:hypothetical protein [Steroidobacteraceae bacterium]
MSARERLESYLHSLQLRLRTHIYARAAAVAIGGILAVTALTVWTLQRKEFSPAITIAGRIAIGLLIVGVLVALLWRPLRRLGRDDGANIFEERLPDEDGRIKTYLDGKRREARGQATPLLALLAADAATIAERTPPDEIVSSRRIAAGALIAGAALVVLVALLVAGPTYWGFGSRHLLLGVDLPRNAVPVRRVMVTPGNATVRRNSDLAIHATVEGFHPQDVQVFVRFADRQDWERAPMQPAEGQESRFEFRLYAVRAPLQYYVDAEGTRSVAHDVTVVDLPRIERVQLTYQYPQWTGLDPKVDDTSRDISAVEGTSVKVEVVADGPLDAPALIVDGQTGELAQQGKMATGEIVVKKPGRYQIGARVANEFVPLSDEYVIEVIPDEKPTIEIRKPGRDWRATSIEEVPVRIHAEDDFRLRDVSLRYSVNGGEWQAVNVGGGGQSSEGEELLDLEEIGAQTKSAEKRLVPGDLISYYAVARDRKESVQTDLFMVQVQPFERKFLQAQGGNTDGGGMADEQGAISERQKEILLATWNLQRSDERGARTQQQLEDSAKMLSELQATLAQQARTLAQRTRARASLEEDERIRTFVESLERAATVMDPAVAHLNTFKLSEAVPFEQQALQQLLRAESAFREVQVSMQQSNAGGDGSQTAKNFTEMFELEMDLEKSQYESESQLSNRNMQKDLDEMIRKLKELAERQEQLAQERQQDLRTPEQRWKQEQLRREAEDLRRRLAELQRQQQQSGDSQQASRGGSASNEARDRDERQREQLSQALESVNKALKDMQSANDNNSQGEPRQGEQAGQAAEQASRNLRRALQQIDRPEPSHFDETLEKFADRSQQMLEEQRRIESELYEALSQTPPPGQNGRGGIDQKRAQELVRSKQQMASDLTNLEKDMRNAVHENRKDHPKSSQRLSDIIQDVEGSDLMYRLNRSAAEIYYGRAREAAPREGLTTDALDTLEQDLREAAMQAADEGKGKREDVTAEALLSQVAELRRALQDAQDQNGQQGQSGQQGEQREGQQGQQQGDKGQQGQNGQKGQQGREGQGGERAADNGRSGQPQRGGLSAWTPNAPTAGLGGFEEGRGSLARQTAQISERIRELANRMNRGDLTAQELEQLRRAATLLRRLSGDPLSAQPDVMLKLIDQIELQALASTAKTREAAAARATLPDPDSPNYREAVAEYYRRLGNQ